MLKRAYYHRLDLKEAYRNAMGNHEEYFKYFHANPHVQLDLSEPKSNDWDEAYYVSVNKENVVEGMFRCDLTRGRKIVASQLSMANLTGGMTLSFSMDMLAYMSRLFTHYKIHTLIWYVMVGNTIEPMYDSFCEKVGGRIVGTYVAETEISDGTMCDRKLYQLTMNPRLEEFLLRHKQ